MEVEVRVRPSISTKLRIRLKIHQIKLGRKDKKMFNICLKVRRLLRKEAIAINHLALTTTGEVSIRITSLEEELMDRWPYHNHLTWSNNKPKKRIRPIMRISRSICTVLQVLFRCPPWLLFSPKVNSSKELTEVSQGWATARSKRGKSPKTTNQTEVLFKTR